jgi:hypothetical protein
VGIHTLYAVKLTPISAKCTPRIRNPDPRGWHTYIWQQLREPWIPSGVHASAFKEGSPWRLREAEGTMRCTSSIPPPTRISILPCTHRGFEVPIVASRHRCIAKPLPNQVNAGDTRAWPPTSFVAVQQTRANELPAAQRLPVPLLCCIVKLSRLCSYLPPLYFPVWPARVTARDARTLTCQPLHTNHTACFTPAQPLRRYLRLSTSRRPTRTG